MLEERDEHQVLFEKLQEEAAYISDQPDVQDQLATIQERWDHVCTASDERTHELQEVHCMAHSNEFITKALDKIT